MNDDTFFRSGRQVVVFIAAMVGLNPGLAAREKVEVDDAYAQVGATPGTWQIGTRAVELTLEARDGRLLVTGFRNKLTSAPADYIDAKRAMPAFLPDEPAGYEVETLWSRMLEGKQSADPATEGLHFQVGEGDFIGFVVHAEGDPNGAETTWVTEVAYAGGERFISADDTTLDQGPVWYYAVHHRGTRFFDYLDKVEPRSLKQQFDEGLQVISEAETDGKSVQEVIRCASTYVPYVMPKAAPFANGTRLQSSRLGANDAMRLWRAPRAGTVTVHGNAQTAGGKIRVEIKRFREPQGPARQAAVPTWQVVGGEAKQVAVGGRPAVQLGFALRRGPLTATFNVTAFPGTSILRENLEIENTGGNPETIGSADHFSLRMPAGGFVHHWIYGGCSRPVAGLMQQADITPGYWKTLQAYGTDNYAPWMAVVRRGGADGWFLATEYQVESWNFDVHRETSGNVRITTSLSELVDLRIPAGGRVALPMVTLGVFRDSLDDMARRVYDWQYEYLWDFARDEWYGRTKGSIYPYYNVRNLQEQFTARLEQQGMEAADFMREIGGEILWDDAGWSESPTYSIWTPSRNGPDYALRTQHLAKSGMNWLLWFSGVPSAGLMDSKVGSWGDFQWRTDGFVHRPRQIGAINAYWEQVNHFLTHNPRSSFHTCDGGSRYSHTFETQRYADVNYFMDSGYGDEQNYYFSYFETPDRWRDVLSVVGPQIPTDTAANKVLTTTASWASDTRGRAARDWWLEKENARRVLGIYRYLRREGVAGRRSYVAHPVVKGDDPIYYFQRLSHDRARSLIILKHQAENPVVIYPRELLPGQLYTVGFQSHSNVTTRTGAELMEQGIVLAEQADGELIYLGLPGRPGGGTDKVAPSAPGTVLSRRETNLGHSGVGLYWSPGTDDNLLSYYEVSRNGTLVGKVAQGLYYFDHAPGWSERSSYAVRAVDGDGNRSTWTPARRGGDDEALTYHALGGHFREQGREGWQAETTTDGRIYTPMTFVPPLKSAQSNSNQPGGVEGYWEGADTARVGRGWQQASVSAQSVRTWIAPRAGEVQVLGRAMREYYRRARGKTLRVRITHNDQVVWPASGWAEIAPGDLHGQPHELKLQVAAGDAVRFVLDQTEEPEPAVIAWMPRLVYPQTAGRAPTQDVIRILAGANQPYTDSAGNIWSADRFFVGGEVMAPGQVEPEHAVALDDPVLFERGREGSKFSYQIPVAPGRYVVRLLWAETRYQWNFERPFDLSINGHQVLRNFDVNQAARGPRRAYARVFRHLVPDAQGRLVLDFAGGFDPVQKTDRAMVQAIEVMPESLTGLHFDCGARANHVDWSSQVWMPAVPPAKSRVLVSDQPIDQAAPTLHDQRLYQTADTGRELVYRIAVARGLYSVQLKFAELWLSEPGQRPMNIAVNGRRVRTDWDPATAAGALGMAADMRVPDIAPAQDGYITISVTATGKNDAILQAIAIE